MIFPSVSRTEFGVCANGKENVTFTWRPMTDGNMRETVLFHVSSSMGIGFKVQAILLGSCSCAEGMTSVSEVKRLWHFACLTDESYVEYVRT
ncbi:unnamed protein product [Soboliphyme baturini]|uniref:Fibronectin type-III domain-containing protein n=1 Tax=Soboliphyme baturini TaxID=241478 RepID=A0A183IAC6_9BILA|nr:unnamed protein product [Soboliphyme baturini]